MWDELTLELEIAVEFQRHTPTGADDMDQHGQWLRGYCNQWARDKSRGEAAAQARLAARDARRVARVKLPKACASDWCNTLVPVVKGNYRFCSACRANPPKHYVSPCDCGAPREDRRSPRCAPCRELHHEAQQQANNEQRRKTQRFCVDCSEPCHHRALRCWECRVEHNRVEHNTRRRRSRKPLPPPAPAPLRAWPCTCGGTIRPLVELAGAAQCGRCHDIFRIKPNRKEAAA